MDRHEALRILGLKEGYTESDLKKAYRLLARKNHPDVAGVENTKVFQKIKSAYDLLSKSTLVFSGRLLTHDSIFKVVKI